jgi:hypothetical protein
MNDDEYFAKWIAATLRKPDKNQYLPGLRMATYHASMGANGSVFLQDTPKEMKHEAQAPPEINYAFALGDALHIATLEPERFDKEKGEEEFFQYSQTTTLDTKANASAFAADPSRPIVTSDLISKARKMRDAIMANHLARQILSPPAEKELSGYAWDEDAHCIRKVRIDFRPTKGNYLVDLKTCDSVNEMKFWSSVKKYKYGAKCAYYMDTDALISNTIPRELFFLIAVTGPKAQNAGVYDAPYMARVFEIASPVDELSLIAEGRAFYMNRLAMFANAARQNDFEGYDHQQEAEILTVFRPRSFIGKKEQRTSDDHE